MAEQLQQSEQQIGEVQALKELQEYSADAKFGTPKLAALNKWAEYYDAEYHERIREAALKPGRVTESVNVPPERTEDLKLELIEARVTKKQIIREMNHLSLTVPGYDAQRAEWAKRINTYKSALGLQHPSRLSDIVARQIRDIRDAARGINPQSPSRP